MDIELKKNHIVPAVYGQSENYLYRYLVNCLGISKDSINSFVAAPNDSDEDQPFNLKNMSKAVTVFLRAINLNKTKVFVVVDSDTDGYTSSAILINYLKRRFANLEISHAIHPGKEHGIVLNDIPNDAEIIFVPDAGTNDIEQQEVLTKNGKTVIVLDHHELTPNWKQTDAIIVNNQDSPDFDNKYMSGAGIVYMFIQALDKTTFSNAPIYQSYRDLAAIGIIADAMNMTALGNNFLAYHGLRNIKNSFIKTLAVKQSRGIKDPEHLTKMDVAFYIAPVINGVIRSGSFEEKELVFHAMTCDAIEGGKEVYESIYRGNVRVENLFDYAVRLATNAKSRQDSSKKRSFERLCEKINTEGLDQHNLIVVPLNEKESSKVSANVTGLIATELVKHYGKPCFVLRKTTDNDKEVYGGSGRNGSFHNLPNLLDFVIDSGTAYYAAGHQSAFGLFIEPDHIKDFIAYGDKMLRPDDFHNKIYEVDYWFHPGDSIDSQMLMEFAEAESLWGQGIPRPTFAFTFNVRAEDIYFMGADKNSIKIKKDGVDFVLFKNSDIANQFATSRGEIGLSIIGAPSLNEFRGTKSVQIMIDNIELGDAWTETPKESLSFADLI